MPVHDERTDVLILMHDNDEAYKRVRLERVCKQLIIKSCDFTCRLMRKITIVAVTAAAVVAK
jgi:hypothetical protein